MSTTKPYLLPEPKEITMREGAFALNADTQILLLPDSGEDVVHSARSLQAEIKRATGLDIPIVRVARPARNVNVILLFDDPLAARSYMPDVDLSGAEQLSGHGEQAYSVQISAQRVVAGGHGAVAAHYAAQTLRLIVRGQGVSLPALEIADWPSLRYRGVMLDVSRGKVPTLETLKELVDHLALYKVNVLQLYTEHTFHFAHHPHIGEGCGPLTGDEILELDAYARERHLELQPNLQSFGHCAHILNMPEYEHLAESPARWSLCPTDEGTYALLDDLYADLLPAFTSPNFNVDCDETWDLGKGRSAEEAARVGEGRVYLRHILRLRELAAPYGRRIQIWGDILLHHPELVAELPEDVTLLDWHYEAQDDYPSVRLFADSGRPFWVCPGTSSWNTLFPRIENSNGNIRTLARLAAEHGAQGLLNTDWGDNGHYQPLGQSYYGYLFGAEQAWTGGNTADEVFDRAFGLLFFGPEGERVVSLIRELGRLNTLEGMPLPNASRSIYALLDDPLVGATADAIPPATLREVAAGCTEAELGLRSSLAAVREGLTIEEMAFSARAMGYAARKVLASQALRADLASLARGEGDARSLLTGHIAALRELEGELVQLEERFRELWYARARHSEMEISLGHYEGVRERFDKVLAWLRERQQELDAGQEPDYSLEKYAQEAEDYLVLGQRFWRRLRELGIR